MYMYSELSTAHESEYDRLNTPESLQMSLKVLVFTGGSGAVL